MKYSKLKHDLEILELNNKHELELLKIKHEHAKNELINKCTHKYDDGVTAREFAGDQRDNWTICGICKKVL
jgi:hypothetical protein